MDLKDFYRLVLRNLVIVIVSTLSGVGVAASVTWAMTPMYEAKIQLFVSTQSSAVDISALVQGSSFSQQRVKSYAQIIPSSKTLNPVITNLRLDMSAEKLAKRVKASAPLDTVLINVSVLDESPARAALIANEIGSQFAKTANELELSQFGGAPAIKVSVVKSASVPIEPASPKVTLNILLGLILGFGLGIGLAILRQIFDTTIKNEQDLDGTALLGAIGFDESAKDKPLITQISRYAARTESFRQLRTNLQYIKADQPPQVIAITSALPAEGKTSSAINLALSMANSGFSVILIEADMRRPKVNKYLGLENKNSGLSEILSGRFGTLKSDEISQYISKFGEEISIDFISSGAVPPNPSELLNSETFDALLEILRKRYNFIVIDCPPSLPVADAAIISTRTDGVVIIAAAGSTKINQYLGAREAINNVGGHILGVVLNMIPLTRSYGDYGYRYGYGYGYSRKYGSYKNYRPYSSVTNESSSNEKRDAEK
jgi:succinoglycan biosynthesis transport protein ExoP